MKRLALAFLTFALLANGCGRRTTRPSSVPTTPPRPSGRPQLKLYFINTEQRTWHPEPVELRCRTPEDCAKEIVDRLQEAPSKETTAPVPPKARVLSAKLQQGILTVNLSKEYRAPKFWVGSEHEYLALYGLVNSLTELEGVRKVKVLIEGKVVESLGGHEDVTEPLERDLTAVEPAPASGKPGKL